MNLLFIASRNLSGFLCSYYICKSCTTFERTNAINILFYFFSTQCQLLFILLICLCIEKSIPIKFPTCILGGKNTLFQPRVDRNSVLALEIYVGTNLYNNCASNSPPILDVGVIVSCTGLPTMHNDTNQLVDGSLVPQSSRYPAQEYKQ